MAIQNILYIGFLIFSMVQSPDRVISGIEFSYSILSTLSEDRAEGEEELQLRSDNQAEKPSATNNIEVTTSTNTPIYLFRKMDSEIQL